MTTGERQLLAFNCPNPYCMAVLSIEDSMKYTYEQSVQAKLEAAADAWICPNGE